MIRFKRQLEFYLDLRGWSAAELSRRSGVKKQSISNWLGGVEPSSFPMVKAVANALGVSVDDLVFGGPAVENMPPKSLTLGMVQEGEHDSNVIRTPFSKFSSEFFCVLGHDGLIREVNPKLPEFLGWTVSEFMSRPLAEFIHSGDQQRTRARMIENCSNHELTSIFDTRVLCKDGSLKWLRWRSITSLLDRLTFSICHDVTNEYPIEQDAFTVILCRTILEEVRKACGIIPYARQVSFHLLPLVENTLVRTFPCQLSSGLIALINQGAFFLMKSKPARIVVRSFSDANDAIFEVAVFNDSGVLNATQTLPSLEVPEMWIQNSMGTLLTNYGHSQAIFRVMLPKIK